MEGKINTELRLESRGASSVPSADLDRTENAFSTRARSNRSTFRDWAANAMWTIPATRMKSRREHRVPLSVALLKELYTEAGSPYLFIGPKTGATLSVTALVAALRRVGRNETAHGFRSSFSDWAHECTAHSDHTIEISLAHATGSDVERSYRRGDMLDKRRKLMEQWAAFCMTPRQAAKSSSCGDDHEEQ